MVAVVSIIVAIILVLLVINVGNGRNYPTRGPGPTSSPAAANSPYHYKNCDEAWADGRSNIPRGDPDYHPALDRDGNGWACQR